MWHHGLVLFWVGAAVCQPLTDTTGGTAAADTHAKAKSAHRTFVLFVRNADICHSLPFHFKTLVPGCRDGLVGEGALCCNLKP